MLLKLTFNLVPILLLVGVANAQLDACKPTNAPCTLPCTATASPSQILPVETGRSDLIVCDQDTTSILYVLIGQGTSQTINYGIPVQPQQCFHVGVQPVPGTPTRTYTSDVWVMTAGPSVQCSYTSKVDK